MVGVLSPGTVVGWVNWGTIPDALGLPGPSATAAVTASDKGAMKSAFDAAGIPTPAARLVNSVEQAITAAGALGYPVMVKVVDSSGSRGVVRVQDVSSLESAYRSCMAVTRADHLLVEQCIEGHEFGAQAFVLAGRLAFVLPHGDTVMETDRASVPIGHHVPFELPAAVERQLHSAVEATVAALALDNCALNFDFMLRGDELFVLEVGARSGATCLSEIVSTHYGVDYYRFMIQVALGQQPGVEFRPGGAVAASLLVSDRTGTLVHPPRRPEGNDIADYQFDHSAGNVVRRFQVGPDRLGHIVVTGGSLQEVRARLDTLLAGIPLEIEPAEEQ